MKKNILGVLSIMILAGFIGVSVSAMKNEEPAANTTSTSIRETNVTATTDVTTATDVAKKDVEKVITIDSTMITVNDDMSSKVDSSSNIDVTIEDVLRPEYFSDEYFRQLNLNVICEEIYDLPDFDRLIDIDTYEFDCWDDSIDISHLSDDYVAPVLDDGTIYMSTYDLTYVYSNDNMTAAFMDLMAVDKTLRKKIMTSAEYSELVDIYAEYADSKQYDVNPYVYHYIVELIDYVYGDKLFDYDFYCEEYPAVALLHEYDKDALKQHFYSVGLFEGRQACENFNVDNYTVKTTNLGECFIKYATSNDNTSYKMTEDDVRQIRLYDIAFEAYVLEVADQHQSSGFVDRMADPYIQGEINAIATYRSRFELNNHKARGHALIHDFYDDIIKSIYKLDLFCENKFTQGYEAYAYDEANDFLNNVDIATDYNFMGYWYMCEDHYSAAISMNYYYVGCGHVYTHYRPNGITDYHDMDEESGAKGFMFYSTGFSIYFGWEDCSRLRNFYK